VFFYDQKKIVALNGPQERDASIIDDENEEDNPLWFYILIFALLCIFVGIIISFFDRSNNDND
jgi:hypothetical protein